MPHTVLRIKGINAKVHLVPSRADLAATLRRLIIFITNILGMMNVRLRRRSLPGLVTFGNDVEVAAIRNDWRSLCAR